MPGLPRDELSVQEASGCECKSPPVPSAKGLKSPVVCNESAPRSSEGVKQRSGTACSPAQGEEVGIHDLGLHLARQEPCRDLEPHTTPESQAIGWEIQVVRWGLVRSLHAAQQRPRNG